MDKNSASAGSDIRSAARRLVRQRPAVDLLAFLEVINRTDHDWKAATYAIGNALQCWEH